MAFSDNASARGLQADLMQRTYSNSVIKKLNTMFIHSLPTCANSHFPVVSKWATSWSNYTATEEKEKAEQLLLVPAASSGL